MICQKLIESWQQELIKIWRIEEGDSLCGIFGSFWHQFPNQCQQHLDFPSNLPSKYYPGPILLNLSVRVGPDVNPMNGLQACMYKRFNLYSQVLANTSILWNFFTCIHKSLLIQASYETFLLVFTRKLYKDMVQVKKTSEH